MITDHIPNLLHLMSKCMKKKTLKIKKKNLKAIFFNE